LHTHAGSPLAVLPHSVPSSVMGTPAGNGGGLPLTTPGGAQLAALAQGAQVAPSAAALLMTGGVGPTAVKGAVIPGIPGARGGAAALPGAGGTALAGFTLVKTNAVKGRTRGARTRAGNDENAIMITTQGTVGLVCNSLSGAGKAAGKSTTIMGATVAVHQPWATQSLVVITNG
jgi:hypothetical protein